MNSTKQVRTLRVVVASPGDVKAERDALPAILDEVNLGIAADRGLQLELLRWETDAYPGFHPEGPQGLIDPILQIKDCDILIGLFWKRFGTPVKDAQSGTEHEFQIAYKAWRQNDRPYIMVYFNQKPYAPRSKEETDQWGQVLEFQRNFPKEGLWWPYKGKPEFEKLVRKHLTQFIRNRFPILPPVAQQEEESSQVKEPTRATPETPPITATVVKRQEQADSEISVDTRIWDDLMSNDPARSVAAVGRIEDRQRKGYVDRLLAIISDQRTHDLNIRIAAGNALGMLGDPRLDPLDIEMVRIPEGSFTMGTEGKGDESPQHEVYLDVYEIAQYPLTNLQYKAFLDANPQRAAPQGWNDRHSPLGKANHPVVNISWNDAKVYVEWLSKQTGKHYRLPTEAEWEKAARGEKDTRAYPWEGEFDPKRCNTAEGGPGGITPVGIYSDGASPYGVMDMAGNVWEWCADWYDKEYYTQGENCNPTGPKTGDMRVLRGGSWDIHQGGARCSYRGRGLPDGHWNSIGVRVSRTP